MFGVSGVAAQPAVAPTATAASFDPNSILGLARHLAKNAYKPPSNDLPDFLSGLTYEQYVARYFAN